MSGLKRGLIISGIALAVALLIYAAAVLFTAELVISLEGQPTDTVEVFEAYTDAGAKANIRLPLLFGHTAETETSCEGRVDTDITGEYTLSYTAEYLNRSATVERIVKVVDTAVPIIETEENFFEVNVDAPISSADEVTVVCYARDNYDGDISASVQKQLDGNICRYTVKDSSGNESSTEIKIIYIDTEGPKISLKGNSTVYMPINTAYKEFGYAVTDNHDKDITSSVTVASTVNMSKNGTYAVTYTATDDAGNSSSIVRRVIVYGGGYDAKYDTVNPSGKVVYMTFDDGPGPYTEQLLDILDSYNVKATFFVTNQFAKYEHLISRINNDGHTVALHTLTHKWDIYKSVEAYLNDFNAMNDIIEKHTGSPTRIFRFPGGTNNKVSTSYCKGIMTALSKHMTDMGYVYFDWNVDSEDTSLTEPSDIINSLVKQVSNKDMSYVLMHDIKKATVEAVPGFIEYCLKNGYTFKVIDDSTTPFQRRPNN